MLIGTLNPNNQHLFTDTENTRFLVAEFDNMEQWDWKGYSKNINPVKLWAEAYHYYLENPNVEIRDLIDEKKQKVINESHNKKSSCEELFENIFEIMPSDDNQNGYSILELLKEASSTSYRGQPYDNEEFANLKKDHQKAGLNKWLAKKGVKVKRLFKPTHNIDASHGTLRVKIKIVKL